ncbi:hypothetical protein ANCDUO_14632 [Ancylostoma duodenale]|uniref:SHSP domain-containing protein n=1 Tax=Ancylostoma duodenale TaxID=51022 RepID=A0A0C2G2Q7_9BILA|nr:hypothetical protein ANCDUO_14632 [Ancylostoma duodenale]
MELWQVPRMMNRMMNEMMRDFDRFDRSIYPYWRDADHSVLHVANETQQPDEFSFYGHSHEYLRFCRSFVRKWTLPESVNLEALHTQLSDKGHLCVEAPKTTEQAAQRRNIPIMAAKSSK